MLIGIANSIGSGSIATRGPELITNGNFNELGSELFVDSNFSNGVNDWSIHPSTASGGSYDGWTDNNAGDGVRSLVSPTTSNNVIYQNVLTSGKYYKTQWDLEQVLSNATFHIASSNSTDYFDITNADDSGVFLATDVYLGLRAKRVSGFSVATLFDFSVKETNPSLSSQWVLGSGWVVSDRLVGTNVTANLAQSISTLEVGATYEVSFEILTRTSGSVRFKVSKANGVSALNGNTRSSVGVHTEQFTNTVTRDSFKIDGVSAFNGTIGNISLKKVLL